MGRIARWIGVGVFALAFSSLAVTSATAAGGASSDSGITLLAPLDVSPFLAPPAVTFNTLSGSTTGGATISIADVGGGGMGPVEDWPMVGKPKIMDRPDGPAAGIPEPGAALLFAAGFGAVALRRRSR